MFGKLNLPTVCTVHSVQVNESRLKLAYLKNLTTTTDVRNLILKSPVGIICDLFNAYKI